MRKNMKRVALVLATLPIHLVVFVAITGVPKPPAITAEGVARVAWGPVLDDAGEFWASRQAKSLVDWMPDGSGLLVRGRRMILDARLHTQSDPGAEPVFLPRIPRNVAGIHGHPGREYMVLGWDTDGNEQQCLYRWDLGDSDPVLLTSELELAAFGAFEPNGPRMAYVSTRRNGKDFDIYVMDPLNAQSDRMILAVEGMWRVAGWSRTADELLLMRAVSNVDSELYLLDIGTGSLRQIADDEDEASQHGSPQWSRDGNALYYTSDRGTEFSHLRRLDLATREEAILSDEIPWDVSAIQQTGDGELLLIAVNEDGRTRHYTSDPLGQELHPLELFPSGQFSAALHPVEPLLLINHSDPLGITRGYTYDLRSQELTPWAGRESPEREIPKPRLIRYPTFDSVDGVPRLIPAFVYPGVGDGPRPVLINIHGGPEAQARIKLGQGAAEKAGITVIAPNVRGSTGYGRTFTALDDWYLREDAVWDIGALLD